MENEELPTPTANPVEDREELGPLVFVGNPNYPYPFNVPKPPRFWMEEQTGLLSEAVETYMGGDKLNPEQLSILHIYLTQFVERAVMADGADRNRLLARIPKIRTVNEIETFADQLSEHGVEIF